MTRNRLFPLEVSDVECANLLSSQQKMLLESSLWHLRYGHLNIKGLKLLSQKEMVRGLPSIDLVGVCEGCVYGKQSKRSFPTESTWRASKPLELIHLDVCGPMHT